jgi:hypothetical protein
MGCDIHCYIEYRKKNSDKESWNDFGGRINPGRNYGLFTLMAAVRDYWEDSDWKLFTPKGLPEDIGYAASGDNFHYLTDSVKCSCGESRYVGIETAERWVKSGSSVYKNDINGKPTWVSNPDWHSHSWLSLEEYRQVLDQYIVAEKKSWEDREKKRLDLIEHLKNKTGVDVKEESWLYKPCDHYDEPEYHAILAAMESFEKMGYESRLVFWFDN